MSFSAGAWHGRARGMSPGWAAFDLKHQWQGALMPETEEEPFPLISRTPSSSSSLSNNRSRILEKPFSSVLLPSYEFPSLADERTSDRSQSSKCQESSDVANGGGPAVVVEKLKELHGWADEDLRRDIYKSVGCSFSATTSLLEGMAFDQSVEVDKEEQTARAKNHFAGIPSSNGQVGDGVSSSGIYANPRNQDETLAALAFGVRILYQDPKFDPRDANGSTEEDVYLRSRRDALNATRSASQHSRAASNAFLRGDHSAARRHSSKAQGQWVVAKELNNEAAKEILLLRNGKNDVWTLDLHGLHKTEALQALSERLQTIELQAPSKRSVFPNRDSRVHQTSGFPWSSSSGYLPAAKLDKPLAPRPPTLQVITGIGKHSKGKATLPTAVKSFLGEKGYHFDEIRPGVIAVRPKFRRG